VTLAIPYRDVKLDRAEPKLENPLP
jgi:hypothetical protein